MFADPEGAKSVVEALLDSAQNVLLIADPDDVVLVANSRVEAFFGVTPEQVEGSPVDVLLQAVARCAKDPEAVRAAVRRVIEEPDRVSQSVKIEDVREFAFELERPQPRVVSLWRGPICDRAGASIGIFWSFRDATEDARYDEQLRTLADVSPIPLIITRPDTGDVLYANATMGEIVGLGPDDLIGRRSPDFYWNPEDRREVLATLRDTGQVRREVKLRAVDGSPRWAMFRLVQAKLSGEDVVIGGLYDITERRQTEEALRQSEEEHRRAREQLEKVNEELRAAQLKLIQTEKMASLGMLVAGIAHEINTPIGAISSMHDTLVRALEKLRCQMNDELGEANAQSPKMLKVLGFIDESNRVIADGAGRVMTIVKRLKSFARLDAADLEDADINEGIEDTLTLVHHELKHGIRVRRELGTLPRIACYPGRLNQVFLNLIMNAKQAIGREGTIAIRTWHEDGCIKISVADDGCGIPPRNLPRIFDPGFTTKGVGVGTGLGLSICYQIVEDHHGSISVESVVDEGTTFTVSIPDSLEKPT
jgi:two-component system NtrC family sensor kinase